MLGFEGLPLEASYLGAVGGWGLFFRYVFGLSNCLCDVGSRCLLMRGYVWFVMLPRHARVGCICGLFLVACH